MPRRYRTKKAYACWDCDKVYLDRDFAQRCCADKKCSRCGVSLGKHHIYTACEPCKEILKIHRVKVVEASAADDGVVWSDTHSGTWEDGYSSSIEEMQDLHDEEGLETPCYVHPCKAHHFSFDPSDILDRCHDDHHEDAVDQLEDVDGLLAFFKAWNAKQNLRSYYLKSDSVIVLDQQRFDELLAQPKELN